MKSIPQRSQTLWLVLFVLILSAGRALADGGLPALKAAARSAERRVEPKGETHKVARGETLSEIAVRYQLSVDDLLRFNPELEPDRIREGQALLLGDAGRRLRYEIKAGDTLTAIAKYHRVTLRELTRWNRGLSPDRIRAGRKLVIYSNRPRSVSESIGSPNNGRLKHARRLPRHRGYVIRDQRRAWGTVETVSSVVGAFNALVKRFPGAPKVRVHDLSLKKGGPIADHRSHQSGRDVDIAYFQKGCKDSCGFNRQSPGTLDAKRQWALLRHWLKQDQVEAIFIDYRLQKPLYQQAKRAGATKDQLLRWFQYPRGRTHPSGVVRHFPKHADHLHVRFHCNRTDPDCKSFRPLLAGR